MCDANSHSESASLGIDSNENWRLADYVGTCPRHRGYSICGPDSNVEDVGRFSEDHEVGV
jgi:hypothetical protein